MMIMMMTRDLFDSWIDHAARCNGLRGKYSDELSRGSSATGPLLCTVKRKGFVQGRSKSSNETMKSRMPWVIL